MRFHSIISAPISCKQSLHAAFPKAEKQKPSQTSSLAALTPSCAHTHGILGYPPPPSTPFSQWNFPFICRGRDFSLLPEIACRWILLLSGLCGFVLIMSAYDSANPVPFWSSGPSTVHTAVFYCSVRVHHFIPSNSPGSSNKCPPTDRSRRLV